MSEAFTFYLPEIIDLSFEFFGEMIPRGCWSWSHEAISSASFDCLKRLHELGLELDQINYVGGILDSAMLYSAASGGHIEIIKYLLEMGADPCIRTEGLEETPLEEAYERNNLEVARLLANKTTIALPLRTAEYCNDHDYAFRENILDLARSENKTEFIELFELMLNE